MRRRLGQKTDTVLHMSPKRLWDLTINKCSSDFSCQVSTRRGRKVVILLLTSSKIMVFQQDMTNSEFAEESRKKKMNASVKHQ